MLTSTDDSSHNLPTTQIQPWSDENAVAVEPINTTQPSSGMETHIHYIVCSHSIEIVQVT